MVYIYLFCVCMDASYKGMLVRGCWVGARVGKEGLTALLFVRLCFV